MSTRILGLYPKFSRTEWEEMPYYEQREEMEKLHKEIILEVDYSYDGRYKSIRFTPRFANPYTGGLEWFYMDHEPIRFLSAYCQSDSTNGFDNFYAFNIQTTDSFNDAQVMLLAAKLFQKLETKYQKLIMDTFGYNTMVEMTLPIFATIVFKTFGAVGMVINGMFYQDLMSAIPALINHVEYKFR